MSSLHQDNVARYHADMSAHSHHGGHDMYIFHRDWHLQNRDPRPPLRPDVNWGNNLVFGTNFLQMHHEMVKATSAEPHLHMLNASIAAWYRDNNVSLPATWNPLTPIPPELGYAPDVSVYPDEIRRAVQQWAAKDGISAEQFLTRNTDNPRFSLPPYFTREGVAPGERGEPLTGARKLADYMSANQLGCCIVFPHNQWHGEIGGAMGTFWTAIADPIFYFGVHWQIDRVFDEYKSIKAEREIRPLDAERLFELNALESEMRNVAQEFTTEELAWINNQLELSNKLLRIPD